MAVLLFGLAGLFPKWIALPSPIMVLGRTFFAALFLALLLFSLKLEFRIQKGKELLLLGILGCILAGHWSAFFQSIKVSTVAIGTLSYSTFPVFVTLLEPLFFREKVQPYNLLLALVMILGVFLITPELSLSSDITLGVLWGLLAGLSFAFLTILNRKLRAVRSSLFIAFYQNLFATGALLPALLFLQPRWTLKDIGLLAVLGLLCTAVSHALFIEGMKFVRAQIAGIIASLEPLYVIGLAVLLLGEIPTGRTLLGGVVILGAAVCTTIREGRREQVLPPDAGIN